MIKDFCGLCIKYWSLFLSVVFERADDEDEGDPITLKKVFGFWTVVLSLLLLFVIFFFDSFEHWGFVAKLLRLIVILTFVSRVILFALIFLKDRKDKQDEIKHDVVEEIVVEKKVERLTSLKKVKG
ncbi:MAG: hypothetical protein WC827_01320 [Candidatus Paceibacterota bacterium]|jgi:hypothetical protein